MTPNNMKTLENVATTINVDTTNIVVLNQDVNLTELWVKDVVFGT